MLPAGGASGTSWCTRGIAGIRIVVETIGAINPRVHDTYFTRFRTHSLVSLFHERLTHIVSTPDMPPDGDSPTRQGSLNHAPGLAMRSIGAVIDLYDWAGHARGEYLLVRRGECSGATYIGRRASLVQNVVGRPDNCWGNHAICAYKYDLEWWGFVAWREPMGPDFTIWRPSCGVPLDSGSNRWLFGGVEGCHGFHERRATLSPDNE